MALGPVIEHSRHRALARIGAGSRGARRPTSNTVVSVQAPWGVHAIRPDVGTPNASLPSIVTNVVSPSRTPAATADAAASAIRSDQRQSSSCASTSTRCMRRVKSPKPSASSVTSSRTQSPRSLVAAMLDAHASTPPDDPTTVVWMPPAVGDSSTVAFVSMPRADAGCGRCRRLKDAWPCSCAYATPAGVICVWPSRETSASDGGAVASCSAWLARMLVAMGVAATSSSPTPIDVQHTRKRRRVRRSGADRPRRSSATPGGRGGASTVMTRSPPRSARARR